MLKKKRMKKNSSDEKIERKNSINKREAAIWNDRDEGIPMMEKIVRRCSSKKLNERSNTFAS